MVRSVVAVRAWYLWTRASVARSYFSPRGFSTTPHEQSKFRDECVTTNKDGSVIVCWHPEPQFPYEMTRPVPRNQDLSGAEDRLKVQYVKDMEDLYHFKPERLQRRDLMRLTWTTKHRWFPNRDGRYDESRKWEKERPYL